MKANRLNLGMKFSIAVTVIIGTTMFAVATLIINFQRESLRQNTAANNFAMTRNLSHDAAAPLLVFDPLRLDELVDTVHQITPGAYAMITDRGGSSRIQTVFSRRTYRRRTIRVSAGLPRAKSTSGVPADARTDQGISVPVRIGAWELGSNDRILMGDSEGYRDRQNLKNIFT
jgi:hypothetical protein